MTPDWLEQATRAAREVGTASAVDGARTRRRVLRSVSSRPARRAARASWVGLAAAALLGGSAWGASATHLRLAEWLGLPTSGERAAEPAAPTQASSAGRTAATEPPPPDEAVPVPEVHAEDQHPFAPREAKPVPTPAAAADRGLSLYRAAHALHFQSRDYARALDAWGRYLAVAPTDAREGLAVEARYNHAICLVRLGRRDEARIELQPFADGAWGGYRQEDARMLLGGIDEP